MNLFGTIYDVAIFGGGFCGLGAAFTAAVAGRKVLLVERRPALGWEATWAGNLDLEQGGNDFTRRLRRELQQRGGRRGDRIDAPITELVLDRLCEQAGVDLLLYSTPIAAQVEGGRVVGVIVAGKSGEQTIRAGVYLDATENARLWRQTGIRFNLPSAIPGRFTIFFNRVGDGCPVGDGLRPTVWDGEVVLEYDVEHCDGALARRSMPEKLREVRERVPALAGALVSHTAVEPFPLATVRASTDGPAHPKLSNLFGAGLWAVRQANTLAGRALAGETAGQAAVEGGLTARDYRPAAEAVLSQVSPPLHHADVVVAGGGTGGAIAAIAAARRGVKTMLIEASPFLGGIGTGGGIHMYYHGLTGGMQDDLDARMAQLTPLFQGKAHVHGFHPEAKKVAVELMAEEAGVQTVYNTTVTGVETEELPQQLPVKAGSSRAALPRRVKGVYAAGPEGSALYQAEVVVDGTGDGDVAAWAGAPYTAGRDADGLMHAYSQSAGMIDAKGTMIIVNFDAGYVDPSDVVDLTRGRRHGLRHYWRDRFGPENRLTYIAPLIGLRNSRQVIGEYRITFRDEIVGRKFPDCVGYVRSHYDNHARDYENESDEAMVWVWMLGNWQKRIGCEIPYRALLPQNVDGLLMGCRALSMTHDAHNQFRMQRDLQRVGEVAGIAAALAVKSHVLVRDVDVRRLQAELGEVGALVAPGQPSPLDATQDRAALVERVGPDVVTALDADHPTEALTQLMLVGRPAVAALREQLQSHQPRARFWSAVALAMLDDAAGVPELAAAVRERRPVVPEGNRTVPIWIPAAALLGRARDARAVPALIGVLQDSSAPLDGLIAAARSLGRIGDPSAAPALQAMLQRTDLPTTRALQVSMGAAGEVTEDARWQLELAAAEALARLGFPQPEITRRWLADPRAYVRRYAQIVAEIGCTR